MLTTKTVTIGRDVAVAKGTTVIVEDTLGNPLVVVVETTAQMNMIVTCQDPNFNQVLRQLGINKVVVDQPLELSGPPAGARELDQQQLAGFLDDN